MPLVFLILLGGALVLPFIEEELQVPFFIHSCLRALEYALPVVAPIGIVASVGLMKRATWSRYVMASLFVGAAIGIAIFFAFFLADVASTPPDSPRLRSSSRGTLLTGGALVSLVQILFLGGCARYVLKKPPSD